jgi:hypothetical protein
MLTVQYPNYPEPYEFTRENTYNKYSDADIKLMNEARIALVEDGFTEEAAFGIVRENWYDNTFDALTSKPVARLGLGRLVAIGVILAAGWGMALGWEAGFGSFFLFWLFLEIHDPHTRIRPARWQRAKPKEN